MHVEPALFCDWMLSARAACALMHRLSSDLFENLVKVRALITMTVVVGGALDEHAS